MRTGPGDPDRASARRERADPARRPLVLAVVADRRRGARRAVRQAARARRLPRHREGPRRARRRQPHRRARRAAHAAGARHRRDQGRARAAARASRAATRGCSPRRWRCSSTSPGSARAEIMDAQRAIETPRRRACRRERHRRRHRASCARCSPRREATIGDDAAYTRSCTRLPSRGRRGLAQPRAGGAADLAAARLLAGAQPHADAAGRAAHSRRPPRARRR